MVVVSFMFSSRLLAVGIRRKPPPDSASAVQATEAHSSRDRWRLRHP
jgi:hypothetical protein